jgi:hypothetical protein
MGPLSIALQAAPMLINTFMGRKQANKDLERSVGMRRQAEGAEQEALGRREYQVGDSWNKFLAASKQDKAADMQRQIASEQEASTLGALKSGGAKALLGGLGGAQRQAAQQRMGIEADSQARQQSALQQYAGVQQGAMDANVGLAAQDTDYQRGMQQEARDRIDESRGRKREATADLVTGLGGLAMQGFGAATAPPAARHGMKMQNGGNTFKDIRTLYKGGPNATSSPLVGSRHDIKENFSGRDKRARLRENRIEKRKAIHDALKTVSPQAYERRLKRSDAALEAGSETLRKMQTGRNEEQFSYNRETREMDQPERKYTMEDVLRMKNEASSQGGPQQTQDAEINPVLDALGNYGQKYGGKYNSGGVQKTPGEFSHAKNPINIMKDGDKIGEMTGGEYIFNPRQASTLQALASKGGSPLHKYVKGLLKEFDRR